MDGVARHARPAPRLANQLVAVDQAAAVRRQRPQRQEGLRPHPDLRAIPQQPIGGDVNRKGAEGDIRHAGPAGTQDTGAEIISGPLYA